MTSQIHKLLDSMLSIIEQAPSIPFTNFKLISYWQLRKILEQTILELSAMKKISPEVRGKEQELIAQAKKEAMRILRRANAESDFIISNAHKRSKELINHSNILDAINHKAEEIRAKIKSEAQKAYQLTEANITQAESKAGQEIENTLEQALKEAERIKAEAHKHANQVLTQVEELSERTIELIEYSKSSA